MARPYDRVIVGTDGSPPATCAVQAACTVALGLEVPLTVATAWYRDQPDPPPPSEQVEYPASAAGMEARWAAETTSEAAGLARQRGLDDPQQATPEGSAADALVGLAGDNPGAVVVVGTVGLSRRSERIVGNVPHQLTHHAPTDVLLSTRRECPEVPSWGTVALATDGSPTAGIAVGHGLSLAAALGATPTLLTVARSEEAGAATLDEAVHQLDGSADVGRRVDVSRDVSGTLVAAADAFDLLVIGNKGMSGPSRLLGSVSNRVTHALPTDILLVNTVR